MVGCFWPIFFFADHKGSMFLAIPCGVPWVGFLWRLRLHRIPASPFSLRSLGTLAPLDLNEGAEVSRSLFGRSKDNQSRGMTPEPSRGSISTKITVSPAASASATSARVLLQDHDHLFPSKSGFEHGLAPVVEAGIRCFL